jgi:preprotein translocase subunit SecY
LLLGSCHHALPVAVVLPGCSTSAGIFLLSSSGLLIVVGVVRDTFMNIDAELKLHGYQEKLLIS